MKYSFVRIFTALEISNVFIGCPIYNMKNFRKNAGSHIETSSLMSVDKFLQINWFVKMYVLFLQDANTRLNEIRLVEVAVSASTIQNASRHRVFVSSHRCFSTGMPSNELVSGKFFLLSLIILYFPSVLLSYI